MGDDCDNNVGSDVDLEKSFPGVCRVCMCMPRGLKSVFSTELARTVEEFEFCTGILMTEKDGLPTLLCDSCLVTLAVAHSFKTTCLRSDKLFREFLRQKLLLHNDIKKEVEVVAENDCKFDGPMVTKKEVDRDFDDENDLDIEREIKLPAKSKSPRQKQNKKKLKRKVDPKDDAEKKDKGLSCDACKLQFSSKELALQHKLDVHGCEWICEICGKQFMHRASHYSHIRSHLPPEQECSYCEYKTWHKADLNKHLTIHTGEKRFVCEYCTTSFRTTSNLHDHIRRNHGGAKEHICPRCGHKFHSTDKLRRHLDTHDNIKRHECDVCHAQFTRRCHWKKHLQKQHSIIVPKIRPGRQKINLVSGGYDVIKGRIMKANMKIVNSTAKQ